MPDTARLTTALGERYVIERELGAGGMATVYLARDTKHEREVALKVLRPELFAVLGAERFLAEIKITARLDHPHILTLIDSGAVDGFLYYVLPYVRGESLRVKLEREKQLSIEEALSITRQVASALDYAHQHGVVHRDIKPENILLHEGEAVLADFGIALAVKEAGGNRLTETGLSLGTPQYMSPEQATGDRLLDARSDVYSLAAVLYEMLAGEPPVTGPTVQAVIAKLMTERPTRIRTVRDTVPEGIDNAVAKALSKVPADRFAHAGQFVQELQASLRPSRSGLALPPAPKRPVAMAAAIMGAAAIVGAIAYALLGRNEAVRVIQPDRQQVTFTGNAWTGGLSPDGQRLAYTTRNCTATGYCTVDLVVQDVAGAGASTILRGWAAIWEIDWTGDGRYLLLNGFQGLTGNWGPFSVPSLGGGQVRFLGCCVGNLGNGDTALVVGATGGDSLAWIRFVTLADGVPRDSLSTPRTPGSRTSADRLAGGRLLVRHQQVGRTTARVIQRDGRVVDSLVITDSRIEVNSPSADGRAVLGKRTLASGTGEFDLLAWPIDDDGRIRREPHVAVRQMRGEYQSSRSGALVNAAGPTDYEVWVLRRDGPQSMRFAQQRLVAGTASLGGLISPAGDRVMLWRRVVQGDRSLSQLSVIASDSGPETNLGPPIDLQDYEWVADGSGLLVAVRRGEDSLDIVTLSVPGNRRSPLGAMSLREFSGLMGIPGGGALLIGASGQSFRVMGVPGRQDTAFVYPESEVSYIVTMHASPDGRNAVMTGWDKTSDSIVVWRVSLSDGRPTRLASFYADGAAIPFWFPDGTLMVPIRETGTTMVWYRLPAAGGTPVRLGTPPRSHDASYRMSADGRRLVARVTSTRPDIYLIRNFSELLPR